MVLIELTFPAGRYHATPWGRHVNEGAVEWPPSPWRLLRTLIAVYRRKRPELDPGAVEGLITTLSVCPPFYTLPSAIGAHTRHYMPVYGKNPTKIFDAFLRIEPDGVLYVCWPEVDLDSEQSQILGCLVEGMSYLGRAESWVEGRLLPPDTPLPAFNTTIGDDTLNEPPPGMDAERVLCMLPPEHYNVWRERASAETKTTLEQERLESIRQRHTARGKDPDTATLTKSDRTRINTEINNLFPETLFEALHADTGDLHAQGWSEAPGTRWVRYLRPTILQQPTSHSPLRENVRRPTLVRIALAPDTISADTRPRIQDTLYLGEQVRRAIMNRSKSLAEESGDRVPQCAPVFSGKDAAGMRLNDNHGHAFYLPCDDDGDGRIDHVLVYSRSGFSKEELYAIGRVKTLWQHGGRPGLLTVYLGDGNPDDFGGYNRRNDQSPFAARSCVWHSYTPYVPTRHPKCNRRGEPKLDADGNWIDSPEMQLRAELNLRGLPPVKTVEAYASGNNRAQWRLFATRRKHGNGARAEVGAMGFRITFESPVSGPIAVGYGCHYGLGLFIAEPEDF